MNRHELQHEHNEEEQRVGNLQQSGQECEKREFAEPEDMIRFDAENTVTPVAIRTRLSDTLGAEPKPSLITRLLGRWRRR